MKKLTLVTLGFALSILLIIVGFSAMANAQTPAAKPTTPSVFDTQKSCEAALASKNFAYYAPVDLSRKNKNPIDTTAVFPVKLEADQCRLQLTMKGRKWIVQSEGSLMRARKNEAGELVIFARNDCGNEDITLQSPPPSPVPTPIATAVTAAVAGELKVHVDGEVNIVHSGKVVVEERRLSPPLPLEHHHGRWYTSKKFWIPVVVGAGAGWAAYYYWPCPPGTVRR